MVELEVLVRFCCCRCSSPVRVTLRCEGEGLGQGKVNALVKVPCPSCHQTNQVIFTPDDGRVIDVMSELRLYRMPVPSLN
jgi:hypothetical protein